MVAEHSSEHMHEDELVLDKGARRTEKEKGNEKERDREKGKGAATKNGRSTGEKEKENSIKRTLQGATARNRPPPATKPAVTTSKPTASKGRLGASNRLPPAARGGGGARRVPADSAEAAPTWKG